MKIFKSPETVYAHCDIPCGIYSEMPSVTAAETVAKMVKMLSELVPPGDKAGKEERLNYLNSVSRMVRTKEDHAELCKKELLILWTDYFKPEHLKIIPDIHEKIWQAAKLCSKNKREVDLTSAKELQAKVAEIGGMFKKVH
jgi:nickel superoxide dismutase